jgi:glyoxylate reductase
MRVWYHDRQRRQEFEVATGAQRADLDTVLERADVVSVHVPSSDETRGMVDGRWFARMRSGAILVNTARGDLVDQPALIEALTDGHLAGAGLDVFPNEPSVHPSLVAHPRVVTLPHLGSATVVTRRAMADLAVRNVHAVLAGRAPLTPVGVLP